MIDIMLIRALVGRFCSTVPRAATGVVRPLAVK